MTEETRATSPANRAKNSIDYIKLPVLPAITILTVSAMLVAGCGKQTTATGNGPATPTPVSPVPFHNQVYKSADGQLVVTLTSNDECELTQSGTTLLCKYTKQPDALRVIQTVAGTPEVIYFRFTDQGLQGNDGTVLLAPQAYADAMRKLQMENEEKERVEAERQRLAAKIAKEVADCSQETATIGRFPLFSKEPPSPFANGLSLTEGTMTISDASVILHLVYHYGPNTETADQTICFAGIRQIGNVGEGATANGFKVDYGQEGYINGTYARFLKNDDRYFKMDKSFGFRSQADARSAHDALVKAYGDWKGKFPDLSMEITP